MTSIASALWEVTSFFNPIHLLWHFISKMDILDIVFIGFCLIGLAASMIAHNTYRLLYPKGTESRQLWSPLAQHPGFLAPDLHHSPETCSWLNNLLCWLNKCSQVSFTSQKHCSLLGNCLQAFNEAAHGTGIVFHDMSFGESVPAVKSVSARICSGPGKELLLHARIFVPDIRVKVSVAHWQGSYCVQLVNSSAEVEMELQLAKQLSTASARLIGRPFVSDFQVSRIDDLGGSQSGSADRTDWLACRIIALLGSALVRLPLSCDGARLTAARPRKEKLDKSCQTDAPSPKAWKSDGQSNYQNSAVDRTLQSIVSESINQYNPSKVPITSSSLVHCNKGKRTSRLLVKVLRASGIAALPTGPNCRGAVVRLELDEPRQVRRTRPAFGVTNPYWDEHFEFDLSPKSKRLIVSLEWHQQQPQEKQTSSCLPLSTLPTCGARVLLPLTQSGSVTLELLNLPASTDVTANKHSANLETKIDHPECLNDGSPSLSRQVAEFMTPTVPSPQPSRVADRLSSADSEFSKRPRQISDYSYARQYGKKATMQFQMSYKKPNANRSRSIIDRIGRVLARGDPELGRAKR